MRDPLGPRRLQPPPHDLARMLSADKPGGEDEEGKATEGSREHQGCRFLLEALEDEDILALWKKNENRITSVGGVV